MHHNLSKYQKRSILKEQADYYRRLKIGNKKKFKQTFVYSTTVVSEPSFKEQYHNFLKSPFWKTHRARILSKQGRCCVVCRSTDNLNVHHISYEDVFNIRPEDTDDIVVVCRDHHEGFHKTYGLKKVMRREWVEYYKKELHNHQMLLLQVEEEKSRMDFIKNIQ